MSVKAGVHSLDSFGMQVPDLGVAAHFFEAFGLIADVSPFGLALRCHGDEHICGRLYLAPKKRLDHVNFVCYPDQFPEIRERVSRILVPAPPGTHKDHAWFTDPEGLTVGIGPGPKTSPDNKSSVRYASCAALARGAPMRRAAPRVHPIRLAHILVFSSDVARSIQFYSEILGLKLSDRVGNDIAFMHAAYGSDHHMIAFARSAGPGLHHTSWEVSGIEDLGLGGAQMAALGYTQGWGIGRHVLGSNLFQYIRDPWGSHIEYSIDMDFVPAGANWPAGDHEPENAFYLWGPEPPAEWTRNREVES